MKQYRVRKGRPLQGRVQVPGDKSIGHRALIFAALAEGPSRIEGLSGGLDNLATANAFAAMGVKLSLRETEAEVEGVGLRGLRMPEHALDCGNSGTSMRLLAGLLAAQHFGSRLTGDASLSRRPMNRIIEPLRARGANISGSSGTGQAGDSNKDELYPPISIAPLLEDEALRGIEYDMPVASAQVKSCLLLSGLYAEGLTAVREPVLSRDHTERMLLALGVPLQTAGSLVVLDPKSEDWSGRWEGFEWQVPGDPSSAAFPLLAALMVPQSQVHVDGLCLNPTRSGLLDLLRMRGAALEITPSGSGAGDEPLGSVTISHQALPSASVGGELLVRMIDEVPALCALAATLQGTTEIRDAQELRVKESDRITVMARVLQTFGVECEELPDGIVIHGKTALQAAEIESQGDHRIAMSGVLLGMVAEGETLVRDVACVETSFPGFADLMRSLGADIVEEEL